MRLLRRLLLAVLIVVASVCGVTYARYGGGRPYPDLSTPPVLAEAGLEIAATFPEPIGNVAVSRSGRLFFTIHPESRPRTLKLVEWRDGRARPYPSETAQVELETPLGVTIDAQERLWVIDHGNHGLGTAALRAFDLAGDALVHESRFTRAIAPLGSFLQDLRVSPDGATVVIADASIWRKAPALVVYDVATRQARRVLEHHPSVTAQDWIIRTPAKAMVFFGGLAALRPAVDGLTISEDGRWVAYGAMAHDTLFRVPLADLRDAALAPAQLADRVEALGPKPLSDGMSSDRGGNILLTDVEHQSVVRWRADSRRLETLFRSSRIRWSDGLSHGPGGWLYIADSAIPDMVLKSRAHIASRGPYFVWRIRTDVPGEPGR
jgi:sugar lactone lactonase YvrE